MAFSYMRYTCLIIIFMWIHLTGRAQNVYLLETGDTTYTYSDPEFELLDAAASGDTSKIKAFLEIGTNVNTSTWDGVTPLMYAAQGGHLRAVEILIDAGARVNEKPYNQIGALLGATIAGHVFVVDTLILNGAYVNTRNIDGLTPLMYAAAYDYELITDVLLFYGAGVNASDNYGNEPIHFSSFYNNLNITDKLIARGADVNSTDIEGFTPLMIAAQNGHYIHVAYLLDHGADMDTTNIHNADALSLAITNRHAAVVELLLEKGADPRREITAKVDMLDLAWKTGEPLIRDMLLENGAEEDKKLRIDHFILDFVSDWTDKDFMLGGQVGMLESKSEVQVVAGYLTRPAVRSVLYQESQGVYYQYWERRSLFYLGADKFHRLKHTGYRSEIGAYGRLHFGYTYGNFRGSNKTPDDTFLLLPGAGFYFNSGIVRIKTGYEYMKLKNSKASPHRVNITLGLFVNNIKNPVKRKPEPDL